MGPWTSRDDDVLLPCPLWGVSTCPNFARTCSLVSDYDNRQSAGDHSDHVTCHTNNEAWVRYEYILGFWDYSGIVSIKSTKRINCVQNIFCLKNGVNNQHCRHEDICFLGNETHWLGNIVTLKEAILTNIKVTKMFDALLSQFLRLCFVRKYTTL